MTKTVRLSNTVKEKKATVGLFHFADFFFIFTLQLSVVNGTYDVEIAMRFQKNRGYLTSSNKVKGKIIEKSTNRQTEKQRNNKNTCVGEQITSAKEI